MRTKNEIKQDYFYCYSMELFNFLKQKGFFAIFVGKTLQDNTVAVFEKDKQLEEALLEYNEKKVERLWK